MRRALLTLSLLAFAFSVATATTYPITVTDDLGREVTLTAPPLRIVSMAPSHTESVCELGACEQLVGADRHSNWPEAAAAVATLGDAFAPDLEALALLEPDFVLVDEYSGLQEPLEQLGFTVYAGTPQTYDETLDFLRLLGRLLDRETEAAVLLGRIEGEIRGVSAAVHGATPPTVFVELDETPYSAGPDSYLGELLTLAGGENILSADMGDFPLVDPEYVVAKDPQVILLLDAPFGVSAATVASRPGWGALSAVTDSRIIELSEETVDLLSRAGPRLGRAVLELAKLLHPERF